MIASSSYRRVIYCSCHYISVIDFDMQIFVELSEKTIFVAGAMKKHELDKVYQNRDLEHKTKRG